MASAFCIPRNIYILLGHNSVDIFLIPAFLVGSKLEDCLWAVAFHSVINKSSSLIIWVSPYTARASSSVQYDKEILSFSTGSRRRKTRDFPFFFFLGDSTIPPLSSSLGGEGYWFLDPCPSRCNICSPRSRSPCGDYCCPQVAPIPSWVFLLKLYFSIRQICVCYL